MARIPQKNERFRTKEQIVTDVVHLLNAPVSWGTKHAVIAEAFWVWTEFDGKYEGCRFWSQSAWVARKEAKHLRHDHAVPKKVLFEELRGMEGRATVPGVRQLFESWCIGVVITVAEDARLTKMRLRAAMPLGWDRSDAFARYVRAQILLKAHD